MEEKELSRLLRQNDTSTKRGWRCPNDNQLAAYVNKQLSDNRKRSLENHFADCEACLETLAFLSTDVVEPELVPPHLVARARALASTKRNPVGRWRWAMAMATATACLLIVFGIVLWRARPLQVPTNLIAQSNERPVPVEHPSVVTPSPGNKITTSSQKPKANENRPPVVRGENDTNKPNVIFPRNGAFMSPGAQPVRWKPVAEAAFYEIKVVADDGSSVFSERTSQTEFLLPSSQLQGGTKYFVHVVAHLSGDRTIDSGLVGFRVAASQP